MNEPFTPAELLSSEDLAGELLRRAQISTGVLEKVATALDNRTFDVFLFLWKYAPATKKQIEDVFGWNITDRAIRRLEGAGIVKLSNLKYFIQK